MIENLRSFAHGTHILARPGQSGRGSVPTNHTQEQPVNKQELIEAVAAARDTSKSDAGDIVDLFFSADGLIAKELKRGGSVNLTGFGSFEVRKRAAREGRNPQTGATIKIKASKVPAFRAGKGLKDTVNKGK